jgi:hypothetical protein
MAIGRIQGRTRIKTDLGIARNKRQMLKTFILLRVWNNKHIVLLDRMGTKRI